MAAVLGQLNGHQAQRLLEALNMQAPTPFLAPTVASRQVELNRLIAKLTFGD